jgi:hypothetical protein
VKIPLRAWHLLVVQLVLVASLVWAANSRITELTELTTPATGDMLEIVDVSDTTDNAAGSSRKMRVDRISEQIYALGSDYTNSTATGTEITGIGPMTAPAAGTYKLECWLIAQNATAANAGDFGVNYTGTVTQMFATLIFPDQGQTATIGTADGTVTGNGGELMVTHGSVLTESTTTPNLNIIDSFAGVEDVWINIHALLTVSDTGDFEIWAASESTTTLTVQSGSYCGLRRIA